MSHNLLLRLYRRQIQAAEETMEAWKAEHQSAMEARAVEEAVSACLGRPAELYRIYRDLVKRMMSGAITNLAAPGYELFESYEQTIAILSATAAWAREFARRTGHTINGMETLESETNQLREFLAEIKAGWPIFEPVDQSEGWEQRAMAESLDLDTTFALAAGVTVPEWRKKIEDHVAKRASGAPNQKFS